MDAGAALLQQLALGLSAYRLYPGNLSQPAFTAAVERIQAAARAALADGPVEAEVRAGEVRLAGRVLADERVQRLAEACFKRRVEHLRIVAQPDLDELAALFAALTREPHEVEEAGGAADLLAGAGARAIVVSAGVPDPHSGREEGATGAVDAAADGADAVDPDAGLPRLATEPDETGVALYERLQAVHARLDDDTAARSSFFRRVVVLVAALVERERAAFEDRALERVGTDAFAERYVGHLTDPELAALLVRVGAERGVDPAALGDGVRAALGRSDTVVALVRAGEQLGAVPDTDGAAAAQRRLAAEFPAADDRAVALVALRDYLRSDARPDQLEQLADALARQLGADVRGRRVARVSALLELIAVERRHHPDGPGQALRGVPRAALRADVLAGLAADTLEDGPEAMVSVLQPFGPAATDALVEGLAVEERRTVRSLFVGALAALAQDGLGPLERHVDHEAWYVARNLATVLARVRNPAAVPLLERLSGHWHPAVRREALHALAAQPASTAAPALARVVVTLDDRAEQEQCLETLAGFAAPEAYAALVELGSPRHRPRLPWGLRRSARRHAARRGRRA